MSLYEIVGMIRALEKRQKKGGDKPMTPERLETLKSKWADLNLPDVRLH